MGDGDVELGTAASAVGFVPTTLTLYQSSNFTGTSYAVQLGALGSQELVNPISKPDIQAAGLFDNVSSVRLACGSRAARVVLLDGWNEDSTSFEDWGHLGGHGGTIDCLPGATTSVNLHQVVPAIADQVSSAILLTHAEDVEQLGFTDLFESAWATALDQLPSEATPDETEIWLTATNHFQVRQFLTIDHWACSPRGAVFQYDVALNQNGTFDASVVDSYVDYDDWDLLDCRNKMQSTLDQALLDAAPTLESTLDEVVTILAPDHARYYFAPHVSLRNFVLFFGADEPVIYFSDLYVSKTGTGTGTITSNPAGINCGSTCYAAMSGTVTLTGTPSPSSFLKAWSGAGIGYPTRTVVLNGGVASTSAEFKLKPVLTVGVNRSVTPNFTALGTYVSVSSPSGTCNPGGASGTCSYTYPNDTTSVVLSPGGTSTINCTEFKGWSGACTNTVGSCTVPVSVAKSVTASFGRKTGCIQQ